MTCRRRGGRINAFKNKKVVVCGLFFSVFGALPVDLMMATGRAIGGSGGGGNIELLK